MKIIEKNFKKFLFYQKLKIKKYWSYYKFFLKIKY